MFPYKTLQLMLLAMLLTACGGGGGGAGGGDPSPTNRFIVSSSAGTGGVIGPPSASVKAGEITGLAVIPDPGFAIDSVTGCNGSLSGNNYVTGEITENCTVTASFIRLFTVYNVTATAGSGGVIGPPSAIVKEGEIISFAVIPNAGFIIDSVTGCDGTLSGDSYTTGAINADCTVSASFDGPPVVAAVPAIAYKATKFFQFNWVDVVDATHYKLLENPDGMTGFSQVGSDISQDIQTFSHTVPLYARVGAQYILQSCNAIGCTDSSTVNVAGNLAQSIGYLKASNIGMSDSLGFSISLSDDGNTLAVGALSEDSATSGINTVPDENAMDAGAVYVFRNTGASWQQEAYIKASNAGAGDGFGVSVSLSTDGNTLAVGATEEDSDTSGINSTANESAVNAGAVYVFTRSNGDWQQEAYIKAANAGEGDRFGTSVSLDSNGNALAVGAIGEDSNTTIINATPNDFTTDAGAVYVFSRSGSTWLQRDFIKGSYTNNNDDFGSSVSFSANGNVLAVGAHSEDRNVTGIDGIAMPLAGHMANSGAVYVFTRTISSWTQEAYIKADQINVGDTFGGSVSLSAAGNVLAVGISGEDSSTTGINTTPNETAQSAGAVYIFSAENSNSTWVQQAYIKASNPDAFDFFGKSISLSADGNLLAVGAAGENSSTSGINTVFDELAEVGAGAVYSFKRSGYTWAEQAYIKASNTDNGDHFGRSVSLSADGNTLAIGAPSENSAISGANSIPDENAPNAGAVYLY